MTIKINYLPYTKELLGKVIVCVQTRTCDDLPKTTSPNSTSGRLKMEKAGEGWSGVELDTKKRFKSWGVK